MQISQGTITQDMKADVERFDATHGDGAPRRRRPRRLSELFAQISRDARGDISVGQLRDALGDRSFAAILVFFAFLNLIPLPPPASAILGLPMIIVAAQLMYGSKRAWLPDFVLNKSLAAHQIQAVLERVIPRLVWLEKYIRPRYWPFWRRRGDRVVGFLALVLAVVVTLPIPGGNWLPSFSITLMGLSLTERDGILFSIGTVIGLVSIAFIVFLVSAAGFATHALWGWMHFVPQP